MSDVAGGGSGAGDDGRDELRRIVTSPIVLVAALFVAGLIAVLFGLMLASASGGGSAATPAAAPATPTTTGEQVRVILSFEGTGRGRITVAPGDISCGRPCSREIAAGTRVTATAEPEAGSTFEGWSESCRGSGRCTFEMDGSRALTARFEGAGGSCARGSIDPACLEDVPEPSDDAASDAGDADADDVPTDDEPGLVLDCHDGIDNDRDGLTDAAQDDGCTENDTEAGKAAPGPFATPAAGTCADGVDNDRDGLTDRAQDPDCLSGTSEGKPRKKGKQRTRRPRADCSDGRDNDRDGLTDRAQDPGCNDDDTEAD